MYDPLFVAARAQPSSRQVIGSFYTSQVASQMDAAIRGGTDDLLSLFDTDSSGFEEGFDGVEVFQNVTHSMQVGVLR